ncbi:MAG: hypothetical protein IPO70_01260 [Bacteroidetes bacterium]|nr:hypothetical protein [Bacteroidota bacterium]
MKTEKDQKKSEPAEKKQDYVRASYALKKKIVDLVSNGRISKNAAAKKYNVSRSSLDYWMNKFSTLEEKETTMSKDKELKKLRQRIEELEFIKDFQQDLIVEYEIETGDLKSKKNLPEQLSKRDRAEKKKGTIKLLCEMFGISRQAYYKRLKKIEKLQEQRAVILDLIKPVRKKCIE